MSLISKLFRYKKPKVNNSITKSRNAQLDAIASCDSETMMRRFSMSMKIKEMVSLDKNFAKTKYKIIKYKNVSDDKMSVIAEKIFRDDYQKINSIDKKYFIKFKSNKVYSNNAGNDLAIFNTLKNKDNVNIIKPVAVLDRIGYYCLIYEYFEGNTLKELIEMTESKIERAQVIATLIQITLGINHLHKLNIVHNDLSLSNIMVDQNQNYKIIDYDKAFIIPNQDINKNKKYKKDVLDMGNIIIAFINGPSNKRRSSSNSEVSKSNIILKKICDENTAKQIYEIVKNATNLKKNNYLTKSIMKTSVFIENRPVYRSNSVNVKSKRKSCVVNFSTKTWM